MGHPDSSSEIHGFQSQGLGQVSACWALALSCASLEEQRWEVVTEMGE